VDLFIRRPSLTDRHLANSGDRKAPFITFYSNFYFSVLRAIMIVMILIRIALEVS